MPMRHRTRAFIRRRLRHARLLATLILAAGLSAGTASASQSATSQSVALGGDTEWKYLTFDPATARIFVAHGSEVTVVDTTTMRLVGRVPGLARAHGVAIVPGGHGYVSSSKSASISVFDPNTLRPIAVLKAGADANSVTYDTVSRHLFVANDDADTVTVIDPATDAQIASIALAGGEGLEQSVSDGAGNLFVDHPAGHDLLRIDTRRSVVTAAWALQGCPKPQGLAFDADAQRLFVSCANQRLLVLDKRDGRQIATLPIGPSSDTVLFDSARHRIYAPSPNGTLSVIEVAGHDTYLPAPPVVTPKGARTAALNPSTGIIYLVTADLEAEAQAAGTARHSGLSFKPGTARLIAIDPARP